MIEEGLDYPAISQRILDYFNRAHLCFMLSSVHNLAMNGRVNPLIAKRIGIMNVRLIGKNSDSGGVELIHKCRGDIKAFQAIMMHMKEKGYKGGRVVIAHDRNLNGAEILANSFRSMMGAQDIRIMPTTGLCSYYGEPGSILVGFESE